MKGKSWRLIEAGNHWRWLSFLGIGTNKIVVYNIMMNNTLRQQARQLSKYVSLLKYCFALAFLWGPSIWVSELKRKEMNNGPQQINVEVHLVLVSNFKWLWYNDYINDDSSNAIDKIFQCVSLSWCWTKDWKWTQFPTASSSDMMFLLFENWLDDVESN